MSTLWVDLEQNYICEGLDLRPAEFEITELDTLKYKGKYYKITKTMQAGFNKLELIDQKQLDDFDTQVQCEEYYGA